MRPRTIFLSRLIGLFSLLSALALLGHKQSALQNASALLADRPLLLVLGLVALACGLALVLTHNVWSGGPLPVVVTLVGWAILVRGLLLLWLSPPALASLYEGIQFEKFFYLYATVGLLIGLYLTYAGFRPWRPSALGPKR